MGTHPIFESDFDCLTEMEEAPRPRDQAPPEPRPRSEPVSEAEPTPDTTMNSTMVEQIDEEINNDVPEIAPELMENSSMQLRQKIELLKREQFDAASMVKQSAVLTKTIRD